MNNTANYLLSHYKGTYRILCEYDKTTNQFPRKLDGIYEDIDCYIACYNNIRIYSFGRGILQAYIPSIGRGHNIIKAIKEEIKVPTGIRSYMQDGEVLLDFPRSGLGFKYYTRLANTIGVIDSDYYYSDNEGHMWVKLRNEGDKELIIKQGDAFCQMIFMPFLLTDNDNFENGDNRNGGFGSTTK